MNNRVRSLVTVVALGIPGVAFADEGEFRAFASSKYTYCDAKVLSALWKQSISDAKATIGAKVKGKSTGLDAMLDTARKAAQKNPKLRCSFHEAGFTYDDALKLAKHWKKTASEAKTRVEDKILTGGEGFVHELLGHKKAASNENPDAGDVAVFLASRYTYCDAKILSAHWKGSVDDAKALIGIKIGFNDFTIIDDALAQARTAAQKNPKLRCSFHEAGFSYDDAVKLAAIWKKTAGEAKARAEDKIVAGNEASVRAMLGKPGKTTKPAPVRMLPPPIKPPPPMKPPPARMLPPPIKPPPPATK